MALWPDFVEIFTRGSIKGDTNSVSRILEKFKFLQKREMPKVCTFGLTLTPFSLLKITEIEKTKYFQGQNSAIKLSKYCKINPLSPLNFPGKI